MAGARVTFGFDDAPLQRELKRQVARLENTEPLLKSLGEEMLPRVGQRFKKERGPDGTPWPVLAPRTIEARLKRYGNAPLTILRMRGHLAGSINYQVGSRLLKIGSGTEVEDYAGIHQFGGQAGRGGKVTIKARPYLGFADEDMDVLADETEAWMVAE